ncbi:trichothecene efflux pump, partial [Colletotrichum orchidophilum]
RWKEHDGWQGHKSVSALCFYQATSLQHIVIRNFSHHHSSLFSWHLALNHSIPNTRSQTKTPDMANNNADNAAQDPQAQQGSRGQAAKDDDWDFEQLGSHIQVTHIDGTIRSVHKDALGRSDSPDSGRVFLMLLAQSLASTAAWLGWVAPANTSSIGFLLVGRLSDLYGRRWIIVGTSLLGVAGCILGSFAKNAEMLIAANICNGMAAAAQLPLGFVTAELVSNSSRTTMVSVVTVLPFLFAILGSATAPYMLNDNNPSQWRWGYYTGSFFALFSFLLYFGLYRPPSFKQLNVVGKTKLEMVKHLDFVGILLHISGCVLLLLGFCLGASSYPSVGKEIIGTLVGGIVALILFVFYEAYSTIEQPLMPPKMFKNAQFTSLVTCATFASMIFYVLTILWPFVIGKVFNNDWRDIAWYGSLLPLGATFGLYAAAFPILRGPYTKILCTTAAVMVLGFTIPLFNISPGGKLLLTVALGMSASFAIGYIVAIAITGVTLIWEAQDIGLASGILGSVCSLGCACVRTLFTLILRKKLEEELPKFIGPVVLGAGLSADSLVQLAAAIKDSATKNGNSTNLSTYKDLNSTTKAALTKAIQTGYASSLRFVFLAIIPFPVVLVVGACFIPDMSKFNTRRIARKLQGSKKGMPQSNEEGVELPGLELPMLGRRAPATEAA